MSDNENDQSNDGGNFDYDYSHKKVVVPIKPHIKNIEKNIADIRNECNVNKKRANELKGDLTLIGEKCKNKCNDITRMTMEDLKSLEKEYQRTVQQDKTESDFFKQLVSGLNNEKLSIKSKTLSLDQRLKQCETDVGMGWNG